jgi:hypothetical protein
MTTNASTNRRVATSFSAYPTLIDAERPSNAELRKICDDVGAAMRIRLAAELAQPSRSSELLLRSFRAFVSSRKRPAQLLARRRAKALFESPVGARELYFGRYARLDIRAVQSKSLDQIVAAAPKLTLNMDSLKRGLSIGDVNEYVMPQAVRSNPRNQLLRYKPGAVAAALDRAEGAKYKKLGLFVKKVDCIEETDELGSDEIAMGGSKTNPDGSTHLIKQFVIDDDFDVGETKTFAGNGKKFAEWNLVTNVEFPCVYGAVMVMAEKDDGGFHDFLVELWKLVGETVVKEVSKGVGSLVGAAIGSAFGGIGAVIGAAIGWLIGALVNWIIELFDNPDDIVATKTFLLGLGAATKSYYEWAKLIGPSNLASTNFNGDGGRYRVWWQYRVYP